MTTPSGRTRTPKRTWVAVATAMLFILLPAVADAATRNGTGRGDAILGTRSADRIDGKGGNDRIKAGKGADTVFGGAGDDVIRSEKNNDFVDGGTGNDFIDGGSGEDRLFGGPGNDSIQGGSGDDRIIGGPGSDRLQGQANTDIYTFRGRFGNDLVIDSSGNKDILEFPDLRFSQVRIERKGRDNVVIITPNGRVEIVDQAEEPCKKTKNGEGAIEGVRFKDTLAQISGRPFGKVAIFKVKSIQKTNCGRTLTDLTGLDCIGAGCDDY